MRILEPARRCLRRGGIAASLTACAFGAVSAGTATAATASSFACRASAVRVEGLPNLNLATAEPTVANSVADPCRSSHAAVANVPSPLSLLLDTTTGVVSATTTSSATSAAATSHVADATVLAASLGLHVTAAQASAGLTCVAGHAVGTSSSEVVGLQLAGGTPITVSGPVHLPAGGLADVELNESIDTGGSLTRRAVDITLLSGIDGGVHIVLGEATVGLSGNPCGGETPTGPVPPILIGYPPPVSTTGNATFTYTNVTPGATLQCSVDGGAYRSCTNVTKLYDLAVGGVHSFGVREVVNGVAGPATVYRWRVIAGCPSATGSVHGTTIGLARLGMTRLQVQRSFRYSSTRGRAFQDFFCLSPTGVRVGYASGHLLRAYPAKLRRTFLGHAVLILTNNLRYNLRGIQPGATLAAARHRLGSGRLIKVGLNNWYLARMGGVTGVLKVRHGRVQEIGIGTPALTRTLHVEQIYMRSFN